MQPHDDEPPFDLRDEEAAWLFWPGGWDFEHSFLWESRDPYFYVYAAPWELDDPQHVRQERDAFRDWTFDDRPSLDWIGRCETCGGWTLGRDADWIDRGRNMTTLCDATRYDAKYGGLVCCRGVLVEVPPGPERDARLAAHMLGDESAIHVNWPALAEDDYDPTYEELDDVTDHPQWCC